MTLAFAVLASGSAGNAAVVVRGRAPDARCTLVDCGLSVRATARRLAPLGLAVDDVTDILLTHLDADHFAAGWVRRIRRHGIRVHVHLRHRGRAVHLGLDGHALRPFRAGFTLDESTRIDPVLLAHDDLGTVGYVIDHDGARLGYATDLGRVPPRLLERFVDLGALAIESNYDPPLERASLRPVFVKRRVMSGRGHLSNAESLDAVLHLAARSRGLAHIVALHLSRDCNHPGVVRRLYAERAPHLLGRLTISTQDDATTLLRVPRGAVRAEAGSGDAQLAMFE